MVELCRDIFSRIDYLVPAKNKEDRIRRKVFKTKGDKFVSKACGLAVNIGDGEYAPHTNDIEEAHKEINKVMRKRRAKARREYAASQPNYRPHKKHSRKHKSRSQKVKN